MNATDWLSSDTFDWIAGGLAISLLVGSFLILLVMIFTQRKQQK
jgi:hypothetical protein